ncbi:FMN-dependent dehydrogenase family protein [Neofusicoccum parvum]|uniref:FMN-dependent dehydrogenase family protein n=1 Tax=Neofusicoccum parvum TaxID=310453 RepID=A0ACB5RY13_9PEZI|nr:FMN-dependent dehydrogenase family protein [Neofusicoccum parvum]
MANRPQAFHPKILTIRDLKDEASKKLPPMYRDYFNEGASDMITLRDNEAAFDRYKIRPRILVNVSTVDTSTTIFGTKVSFPLGFAPAAMHKLAHPDGEVATSRAAAKAGICMGLSAYSTTSMEEVAEQGMGNPYVIQLTMLRDRSVAEQMLRRAESSGYKAVFLTVDCPVLGLRLNEYRNNFTLPDGMTYPNLTDDPTVPFSLADGDPKNSYDNAIIWDDIIPWLRSRTGMQLWLKGVYTADDVTLAIRHGLDGVVVSNHGGRQLDGVPATLDALRECAGAAAGRIQIALDGGVRRGSDVFKAVALGAQCVFVGRVPIWGLAVDGQEGVELAVKILMAEFRIAMALAGCKSVKEINRSHLSLLGLDGVLAKL